MSDAEIKIKVNLDDAPASKGLNNLSSKADKLSKSFASAGKKLTVGLTLPIVGFGVAAVKSAMELEATEAKYNTVFEGMTDDADAFIKKFQELTPATTAGARSMASGIQDLLVPMGFAREEATKMTGDTMNLVGALTNFNSATHSAEDVSRAFQSALTGEMQSLKGLGIQIDAATLTQRAMEMSGKANADEITKQDKAMALMALSYEQSGDALAAYNEESLDTKTKLDLATKGFQDQMAVLGEQLIPIVIDLVGWITKLTSWFAGLDEGQQKTILTILGIIAAVGPMLLIFSKLILLIKGIAMAFTFLAANPIVLIIAAIIAIVILLIKNFDKIKPVLEAIGRVFKKIFQGVANFFIGVLNTMIKGLNAFIALQLLPFNLLIKALNKIPGVNIPTIKLAIPKIPKLDTGTNYVKRDGLAYIHQGEAVVPKKYNPAAGGTSTSTTQNVNNSFEIENLNVRNDSDINLIAEQLYFLQKKEVL